MRGMSNPYQWSNWFAWFPVRTEDGEFVWFETVERKLEVPKVDFIADFYIYRKKPPVNNLGFI